MLEVSRAARALPRPAQPPSLVDLILDGLARLVTRRLEDRARAQGYQVLNLDVRETQLAAIKLYEALGFETRREFHFAVLANAG